MGIKGNLKSITISLIGVVIIGLSALAGNGRSVIADQGNEWTEARRVPGFGVDAEPPYLVADSSRVVHALTSQTVADGTAVMYSRWTKEQGWTEAADVVLSPQPGGALISGAYLDAKNILHAAFVGGNDVSLNMYYTRASAAIALRPSSWARPVLVGQGAGPTSYGAIVGGSHGDLYIVYSGRLGGLGLYCVRSTDQGATWSKPALVYSTQSVNHSVAYIQGQVDSQGRLHVVWAVVNASGNGDAIYYANVEGNQTSGSSAVLLAEKTENSADYPSLMIHQNELFVVYTNGRPPIRWLRRSSDAGRSWTKAVNILDGWVGGNGAVALLHDGNAKLHTIFANRVPNGLGPNKDLHGVWHSVWDGSGWAKPAVIISGLPVTSEQGMQFSPTEPRAVISQGNILLATWITDRGAGKNGIWYSYRELDALELPLASTSSQTPSPIQSTAVVATQPTLVVPAPTSSRFSLPSSFSEEQEVLGGREDALLLIWSYSLLPVILLVSAVIGGAMIVHRRR